jgi:hypothetical protein
MRIKKGFELRDVCGEHVVVGQGVENIDFSQIISLNESAAYLWNAVIGSEFNIDTLTKLLCEEYEVDETTAHKDSEEIAKRWIEIGVVDTNEK